MRRKGAAAFVGALLVVLGAAAVHTHGDARDALGRAEDLHARGDDPGAVRAAGDAARGRVPFSGVRARALSLLGTIAHDAETRGDAPLAQAAARETLAAERATAWPGMGPSAAAQEAEATMERLAKKQGTPLPEPPPPAPRWPPLLAVAVVVLAALGLRRFATSAG